MPTLQPTIPSVSVPGKELLIGPTRVQGLSQNIRLRSGKQCHNKIWPLGSATTCEKWFSETKGMDSTEITNVLRKMWCYATQIPLRH